MRDLSDLLIAISVLIPALASAFVLVWNTVRGGRKVAKTAAEETAAAVLEALKDGNLSAEDMDAINRAIRDRDGAS